MRITGARRSLVLTAVVTLTLLAGPIQAQTVQIHRADGVTDLLGSGGGSSRVECGGTAPAVISCVAPPFIITDAWMFGEEFPGVCVLANCVLEGFIGQLDLVVDGPRSGLKLRWHCDVILEQKECFQTVSGDWARVGDTLLLRGFVTPINEGAVEFPAIGPRGEWRVYIER